jgi:hypothetical protein
MNTSKNWNCDGDHCRDEKSQIRVYPLGSGGNLLLCPACFAHENAYRAGRGGERAGFPQVSWECAEIYGQT